MNCHFFRMPDKFIVKNFFTVRKNVTEITYFSEPSCRGRQISIFNSLLPSTHTYLCINMYKQKQLKWISNEIHSQFTLKSHEQKRNKCSI